MTMSASELSYKEIDPERIDEIQPLWEKLRAHHGELSWQFAHEMPNVVFEIRKKELLAKAQGGMLRVDVVTRPPENVYLAYCISSISGDGQGEIDSMFVEESFRSRGIGAELTGRALAWMKNAGVKSRTVMVAGGNERAVAFYARFGFRARTIVLKRVHD